MLLFKSLFNTAGGVMTQAFPFVAFVFGILMLFVWGGVLTDAHHGAEDGGTCCHPLLRRGHVDGHGYASANPRPAPGHVTAARHGKPRALRRLFVVENIKFLCRVKSSVSSTTICRGRIKEILL